MLPGLTISVMDANSAPSKTPVGVTRFTYDIQRDKYILIPDVAIREENFLEPPFTKYGASAILDVNDIEGTAQYRGDFRTGDIGTWTEKEDGLYHGELDYDYINPEGRAERVVELRGLHSLSFTESFEQEAGSVIVVAYSMCVKSFFSDDKCLVALPRRALYYSTALESVDISASGVKSLGEQCFMLSTLQTLRLPKSVTFGEGCFWYCNSLRDVYLLKNVKADYPTLPYAPAGTTFHFADGDTIIEEEES